MSLVNTETGEIVDLDQAAAERRAERIHLRLDAIADNYRAVLPMIREAIEKRDHFALGYRSPGDYVSDRFGQALAGLGMEVRRAVVGELTQAGLSTRAIAPVVGVSERTAAYDAARVQSCTPQTPEAAASGAAPTSVRATSQVAPTEESDAAAAVTSPTDDVTATTREAGPPAPARPPVVGIDGKRYSRPTPAPAASPSPRRRPLTDAFFDATYEVRQAVEKASRLTTDDRFPQNADQVAARHRNDLIRSRDLLEQVINKLDTQEHNHD